MRSGAHAAGSGHAGDAPGAVGEVDLAVVTPIRAAKGRDRVLHHHAGDPSPRRNDLHGGAPARRREEADRFPIGREERGEGTLGIGEPACIRAGRARAPREPRPHRRCRQTPPAARTERSRAGCCRSAGSRCYRPGRASPEPSPGWLLGAVRVPRPSSTPASSVSGRDSRTQEPAPPAASSHGQRRGSRSRRLLAHERRGELAPPWRTGRPGSSRAR